jgi:hypothetical protein
MRRVLPAMGLYFLAPLVAEFLLGDIPITSILLLLGSSTIYGGGALLIREVVRRARYGWPTMIAFALAYGVIEEGFGDMTLFNPNFAGYHLLAYGYIPALGISPNWTLFVLGLHTVWSISVPIAIVETLVGSRRTTPWLGKIGLSAAATLYMFGVTAGFYGTIRRGFVASVPQFVGAGIATVAIITIGILLGRRGAASRAARRVPCLWGSCPWPPVRSSCSSTRQTRPACHRGWPASISRRGWPPSSISYCLSASLPW